MARRSGRKGDYLAIDQYTGFTCYASQLKRDFWGSYARKPLLRNMQEISSPLNDPRPVPFITGSSYETSVPCDYEIAPRFVGNTNVLTNTNNAAIQVLGLQDSIPYMSIGCTFEVA